MDLYELITKYKSEGTSLVLVTVTEKTGDGPVEVGKKMLVTEHNEAFGTVGGGALEYNAREECKNIFISRESFGEKYLLNEGKVIKDTKTLPMVCGGVVKLFYEYIGPMEYIYIFGAGHVGQALTNILKTMNFHVTVIDGREHVYNKFSGSDIKILSPFAQYIEDSGLRKNSFVVVCTPSHKYDYNVVNKIIEKEIELKYLGMLCSPQKLSSYLDKTYEKYGKDINLKNFYSPIGIDLGGGSPEEIAISITAEILAVKNNKSGHVHMRRSSSNGKYNYWED